jgi:hypothetical protein
MPTRRELLQAGLAISVVPWTPRSEAGATGAAQGPDAAGAHVHSIYRVVSDVRFPEGAALAREAERLGASVARIRGDVTDFWFHDLSIQWKTRPLAVAGLTAHGPLFCLERWGWDHGLRVVYRGSHRTHGREIEHVISGPAATIDRARELSWETDQWARGVAHLVTTCPIESGLPETLTLARSATRQPDEPHEPLVSWVIAARRRA